MRRRRPLPRFDQGLTASKPPKQPADRGRPPAAQPRAPARPATPGRRAGRVLRPPAARRLPCGRRPAARPGDLLVEVVPTWRPAALGMLGVVLERRFAGALGAD